MRDQATASCDPDFESFFSSRLEHGDPYWANAFMHLYTDLTRNAPLYLAALTPPCADRTDVGPQSAPLNDAISRPSSDNADCNRWRREGPCCPLSLSVLFEYDLHPAAQDLLNHAYRPWGANPIAKIPLLPTYYIATFLSQPTTPSEVARTASSYPNDLLTIGFPNLSAHAPRMSPLSRRRDGLEQRTADQASAHDVTNGEAESQPAVVGHRPFIGTSPKPILRHTRNLDVANTSGSSPNVDVDDGGIGNEDSNDLALLSLSGLVRTHA